MPFFSFLKFLTEFFDFQGAKGSCEYGLGLFKRLSKSIQPISATAHHHVPLQDIKHHNLHSVRSSPIVYSALLSRRQRSCYYHFNSHNSNIVTIIRNSSAWPLSEISDLRFSSFSSFYLILLYLFPYHSSISSLT